MSRSKKIKILLQEAELYHSQGLLLEAKGKYDRAADMIRKHEKLNQNPNLLKGITKKVKDLKIDADMVGDGLSPSKESGEAPPDPLKNHFPFPAQWDRHAAVFEGAAAFAKSGRIEKALGEMERLLEIDPLRVLVAKNILRCLGLIFAPEKAIQQYELWLDNALFRHEQLEKIRVFLEGMLIHKGLDASLPHVPPREDETAPHVEADVEPNINSVEITRESGPGKGNVVAVDVLFQRGDLISLIVSSKERALIDSLKVGSRVNDAQFHSIIGPFRGAGFVSSKSYMDAGPKQGEFSLDVKIAV